MRARTGKGFPVIRNFKRTAAIFGILKLVSTGYRILGYINLPIFILTAIIIGRRKISKAGGSAS